MKDESNLVSIYQQLTDHTEHLVKYEAICSYFQKCLDINKNELELQRRALIGLKTQRDIDRNRRLMLIRRLKRERDKAQVQEFKLKMVIGTSLLLSIISLIVKL